MSFSLNVEWKEVSSCHCSSVLLWLYMVYTPTLDELCAFPVLFLSLDPAVCKKLTRYYAQATRQNWGKDSGKMHGKQSEKLRLWVGLGDKIGNLAWSFCQRFLNVFGQDQEPLRVAKALDLLNSLHSDVETGEIWGEKKDKCIWKEASVPAGQQQLLRQW